MPSALWFSEINGQCFGIVHDVQSCHPWVERSLYNVAPSEAQKGLISAVCVILISLDLRTILFSNRAQKRVHLRSIFFFSSAQLFGIIFLFRLDTIWQEKNLLIFEKHLPNYEIICTMFLDQNYIWPNIYIYKFAVTSNSSLN